MQIDTKDNKWKFSLKNQCVDPVIAVITVPLEMWMLEHNYCRKQLQFSYSEKNT